MNPTTRLDSRGAGDSRLRRAAFAWLACALTSAFALGATASSQTKPPADPPAKPTAPAVPGPSQPPGLGPKLTPPGAPKAPKAPATGNDVVKVESAGMWRDAEGRLLLGVRFTILPEWHVYWSNSGEGGMPTTFGSTLPAGWSSGEVIYPRPDITKMDDATMFGYEEKVVFLVPVKPGATAKAASATISTKFLVCKSVCLLGSGEVKFMLPDPATISTLPLVPEVIDGRSIPKPLAAASGSASLKGESLQIRGMLPAGSTAKEARFLPFEFPGFSLADQQFATGRVTDKGFDFDVKVSLDPSNAGSQPLRAGGLVTLGSGRGDPCFEFTLQAGQPGKGM